MEAPELDVFLKTSRRSAVYLCVVHVITALAWWLLAPSGWLKWLMLLCIFLSAGFYLYANTGAQRQYRQLQWHSGTWYLINDNGHRLQMSGLQSAFVSQVILIMRFRDRDGRCLPLVLWPDALDKTTFRRLRMYCRDQRFYRQ